MSPLKLIQEQHSVGGECAKERRQAQENPQKLSYFMDDSLFQTTFAHCLILSVWLAIPRLRQLFVQCRVSAVVTLFPEGGRSISSAGIGTPKLLAESPERRRVFFLPAYSFGAACSLLAIIGTNAKGFLSGVLASSPED